MTSSFPFFRIAQNYNISYRDVLAMAEHVEKDSDGVFWTNDPVYSIELYCVVEQAVRMEQARRISVLDVAMRTA